MKNIPDMENIRKRHAHHPLLQFLDAAALAALLLALSLLFPHPAYAVPGEPSDTRDVWLDIEATVPDGFRGDVTAVLENTESHEYYTIEAHYVGNYRNSIFVPTGEYVLDNLYTSEDINAYGITMDETQFTITDSTTLRPEVFQYEGGLTAEEMEELLQRGPGTIPEDPDDTGYRAPEETETPAVSPTPDVQPTQAPTATPEPTAPAEPTQAPEVQEDAEGGSTGIASVAIRAVTVFAILFAVGLTLYALVKRHNSLE